jgi:transcriptional regulator with XRE-family HTH domain
MSAWVGTTMTADRAPGVCGCGTRLARDNISGVCGACTAQARSLYVEPPVVPRSFWQAETMREALAVWHMGRVIHAFRTHPYHARPIPQEVVADWMGLSQTQLSRIEKGAPIKDLDRLTQWAYTLRIPADLLWFKLPQPLTAESVKAHHGLVPSSASSPVASAEEAGVRSALLVAPQGQATDPAAEEAWRRLARQAGAAIELDMRLDFDICRRFVKTDPQESSES